MKLTHIQLLIKIMHEAKTNLAGGERVKKDDKEKRQERSKL